MSSRSVSVSVGPTTQISRNPTCARRGCAVAGSLYDLDLDEHGVRIALIAKMTFCGLTGACLIASRAREPGSGLGQEARLDPR